MNHSLKDKVEVIDDSASPLPQQMPTIPTGHLFEFCSRDYWLSLDTGQLIKWTEAVSWYLSDRGMGSRLSQTFDHVEPDPIDLDGSGRVSEDFEGQTFAEIDLYKFMAWANHRLVWLSKGKIIDHAVALPQQMPTMPTGHLFEFCSRDYWLSLHAEQLIKWIEAVSWYLGDPNEEWGLAWTVIEPIDLDGSGRVFEDFEGQTFAEADLYDFLCWASQRLVFLSSKSEVSSPGGVLCQHQSL